MVILLVTRGGRGLAVTPLFLLAVALFAVCLAGTLATGQAVWAAAALLQAVGLYGIGCRGCSVIRTDNDGGQR